MIFRSCAVATTNFFLVGLFGYLSVLSNTNSVILYRYPIPKDSYDIAMQIGRFAMMIHILICI